MIRGFYMVSFVMFFAACNKQKPETKIPDYVLDKEQFSKLICDFTLAEAATNLNIKNVSSVKSDSTYAFNPLFDANIKRKTFDTTLYFYSHHPEMFKEVYELALEKLSRLQTARK